MQKRIKSLFYAGVAALSLASLVFFTQQQNSYTSVLQTSVLTMLKSVNEMIALENPPDLSIEKVTLKKVADPSADFNYFKYKATLLVHNYGGAVVDGKVVLRAGDQKNNFVRNTDEGFTLRAGGTYIVDNFDVVFDADYNGGELIFKIDLQDKTEARLSNNSFPVATYENPAEIANISIASLNEANEFELKFELPEYAKDFKLEAFTSTKENVADGDIEYDNVKIGDRDYEYARIANGLENVSSKKWYRRNNTNTVKFSDTPFEDQTAHYFYVKATTPSGDYIVSDVLEFSPQEELTRSEFAKYFLEESDAKLNTKGGVLYEDVEDDPYITTLYNLGLLDPEQSKYRPEDKITRSEATVIILHYFDVDLTKAANGRHFEDVKEGTYFYNFVEALHATGPGKSFEENFYPERAATKNFVKYLVNAYK